MYHLNEKMSVDVACEITRIFVYPNVELIDTKIALYQLRLCVFRNKILHNL